MRWLAGGASLARVALLIDIYLVQRKHRRRTLLIGKKSMQSRIITRCWVVVVVGVYQMSKGTLNKSSSAITSEPAAHLTISVPRGTRGGVGEAKGAQRKPPRVPAKSAFLKGLKFVSPLVITTGW